MVAGDAFEAGCGVRGAGCGRWQSWKQPAREAGRGS